MISTDLLFHSFTRPLWSMPKMGALAVSMKVCSSWATVAFSISTFLALGDVLADAQHADDLALDVASRCGVQQHLDAALVDREDRELEVRSALPFSASSSTLFTDARKSSEM